MKQEVLLRRKLKPAIFAIFASFFFQMYDNMGLCRVATACLYVAALYENCCGLIPTLPQTTTTRTKASEKYQT